MRLPNLPNLRRSEIGYKFSIVYAWHSDSPTIPIAFHELKNEQECFIGFKTTRRSRAVLDPIKHVLRVSSERLQKHSTKSVCLGSPNKGSACERKILAYKKNKLCLRPRPHVSGYFWIRNFFIPDSKISASTRSVFSVFISHVIKTKNRNRSINKFKDLGYDRWLQYKQPRQESGLCCF